MVSADIAIVGGGVSRHDEAAIGGLGNGIRIIPITSAERFLPDNCRLGGAYRSNAEHWNERQRKNDNVTHDKPPSAFPGGLVFAFSVRDIAESLRDIAYSVRDIAHSFRNIAETLRNIAYLISDIAYSVRDFAHFLRDIAYSISDIAYPMRKSALFRLHRLGLLIAPAFLRLVYFAFGFRQERLEFGRFRTPLPFEMANYLCVRIVAIIVMLV